MQNQNKPTSNGRASICHWELEFSYRTEKQIVDFLGLLISEELLFDFEYEKRLDDTGELHYIVISGCWAANLVRVAQLAEQVDYDSE